jgi:hypothetical protein
MKTYCKCNLWLKVQLGSFMVDYPYHILVCQEYEMNPSIRNSNKSKETKFDKVL